MAQFNYTILITGDCQSNGSGIISIQPYGGTSPYTIQWVDPDLGQDLVTSSPSIRSGLSSGDYAVRVNDSTLPVNSEFYINIPVSNGVCCQILGIGNTTCSQNNGSVTGSSTSNYSSTNFYLYNSASTVVNSGTTNISNIVFTNLTAGTYFMVAEDLGGCTGRSETFVIQDSEPFDFGLYIVPNSSCGGSPIGKIIVTGQTGLSPYTYVWSNGATGSTVTGLTEGTYSVQVTDSLGCQVTQTALVGKVDPIGFGNFIATPPTCFQNDGALTLTITGGTAPYYYSATTGAFEISYSQQFTISNLSAGQYNFQVTDSGFCPLFVGTTLSAPQGVSSVSVTTQNSTCSQNNGKISINVIGGTPNFTYTIIYPDGSTETSTTSQSNYTYSSLQTGTYSIAVTDANGCQFLNEYTIIAEDKYTLSLSVTGTSCNVSNGIISAVISTGATYPVTFSLDGLQNFINTNLSAVTFNNVSAGQHTVTITDYDGCVQTSQIYVDTSEQLNFSLYPTDCGSGNNGTITAFISSGTPPFTFNWSNNVSGNPQQIIVSGLTAGTYSLTITDSDGCTLKRSTTISCYGTYSSYQTYVMGEEQFTIETPTTYGLLQMLNEGFADLTSGNTSCDLVSADFIAIIQVQPLNTVVQQTFFTSTSLVSVPSDNDWFNTIKQMLLSVFGVGNVTINYINNQITIETSTTNNILQNQEIIVELKIVYNIMCLT